MQLEALVACVVPLVEAPGVQAWHSVAEWFPGGWNVSINRQRKGCGLIALHDADSMAYQ